ncbi:head-tail adaptor protein [Pseudodonghicola flavimaris]|uniref:Head-tail adaptor protein n=1 Tax=Pseudodonghicola flavimaris TaxID=3050036 RepID=A0ABT7EZ56_9RHOB|nr:head-tail adaptor protein [Pseudodonghicola flavimaris]MDK3017622.1 head-tail adaptor protein [Pseudodonghicola flavimaris]
MGLEAYNRRISILAADETENDAGEMVPGAWLPMMTVWASYQPVSDGEKLRAAAVEQRTDARFRMAWLPGRAQINGRHRLRFDGHDWQISGVKEIGFREELELTAWHVKKAPV